MKDGNMLLAGMTIGIAGGALTSLAASMAAPPIRFSGQWAWLNQWGEIGVAFAAGWFVFVLVAVLTIFVIVASGFNEMGVRQ